MSCNVFNLYILLLFPAAVCAAAVSAGCSAADLQADVLAEHSNEFVCPEPRERRRFRFGPWWRGQPGSFELSRSSGANRLEPLLERRPLGDSVGRLEERDSASDSRSIDSLDTGELMSLSETPGDAPTPKAWGGKAGVLSLDLSQLHLFDHGDGGSQTPGSMPSTPSPLENAKPFHGASSLNDDSFLFSDNVSLGESFNSEVRPKIWYVSMEQAVTFITSSY